MKLPRSSSPSAYGPSLALFSCFLRLPDLLVASAHFRPEVTRKIRETRDRQLQLLKKADEDEKAVERKVESDKKKKQERDAKLSGLSAAEQRKFLEKEKEKGQKKSMKKMTMRA
jgi:HD-like signal output (HDOD) protein